MRKQPRFKTSIAGNCVEFMRMATSPHFQTDINHFLENLSPCCGFAAAVGCRFRACRAAMPDDCTILFSSRSGAIDITLSVLRNDLAPIDPGADQPTILIAREDLPVDEPRDFVGYLKTQFEHHENEFRRRASSTA